VSVVRQAIAAGELLVTLELAPRDLGEARHVAAHGVHAVTIPDGPLGRFPGGSIAAAREAQATAAIAAIPHCTARGRHRDTLRAELLDAHDLGIRTVLALTGDAAREGAGDLDSIGLVELLTGLEGADFCVGVAVNPNANDLPAEVERLRRKHAAGAEFAITQPIYDLTTLERLFELTGAIPMPIVLGVLPLRDGAHADRLHETVPGIDVPAATRQALHAGADGLELARAFLEPALPLVDGLHLMAVSGDRTALPRLLGGKGPATA